MYILSHGKLVSILQYFTDKIDDYWHILYPLEDIKSIESDPYLYFYDISRKATDYSGEFSDDGIYLFLGYDGKYHPHALEAAQYSLACWIAWRKSKDEEWRKKALLHCNWLLDKQDLNGAFRIQHKNPLYSDLPDNWPSALAQGLAISSLIRAYKYTQDNRYLAAAKKACDFMEYSTLKGGLKRDVDINHNSAFIYEEYPRQSINGVLNGYISAVLGIYELSKVDVKYVNLYQQNEENLKRILPLFDTGYWSLYALDNNLSSGFYHRYVITQLRALSKINPNFEAWANTFEYYTKKPSFYLKALIRKTMFKLK